MKCNKCKKETDEVIYLGEFGQNFVGKKDNKEYCEECFNKQYPQLKDLVREESND